MLEGRKQMTSQRDNLNEEKNFGEFRRKVKSAEVLSASMGTCCCLWGSPDE